MSSFQRSVVNM